MRTWLKKARLDSNLTMKQIAEKLNISESYYCYIEKGLRQRDMDFSLVKKLSDTLKLSLNQILLFEEDQRNKPAS